MSGNELPNGFVLTAGWLPEAEATEMFVALKAETLARCVPQKQFGSRGPWFNRMKLMGRFGDPDITYTYKDKAKPVHAWTPTLTRIRARLKEQGIIDANCVVANYYLDRTANLYPHTDISYIPQLGPEPTIVSVSFGATRDFGLVPIANKGWRDAIMVPLSHGDLLIMSGRSQQDWKHGMPDGPEGVGARLSLTFRRHTV